MAKYKIETKVLPNNLPWGIEKQIREISRLRRRFGVWKDGVLMRRGRRVATTANALATFNERRSLEEPLRKGGRGRIKL